MCQMPNIWHIWHICHTKHKKHQIPDVPNPIIFTTCKQYRCKFATVRNQNGIILIIFYSLFSLLSLQFILFSSLSPLFSLTGSLSSQPPIPSVLSFPFNLRLVWWWSLSLEAQAVTPQPNFIINLWVYMHVIVLITFKCMKLWFCDFIEHICSFNMMDITL